jgi:HK97 family phage prohead protease
MTATLHRALPAQISAVGDRQFRAIASNSDVGRDGLRLVTAGIDFSEYMKNHPVLLYGHDMMAAIGRCLALWVSGDNLIGTFEFAPAGVSDVADRTCGLLKARCLNSLSLGFDALEIGPPDKKTGVRIVSKTLLLEISVVAVPALASASVLERTRSLPDRAKVLLTSARDHLAMARTHSDVIADAIKQRRLAAADEPHARLFDNIRGARAALDEVDDRSPSPGRRLSDAMRYVYGASAYHRDLGDALDARSIPQARTAHAAMSEKLRGAKVAVDDLLGLAPVPDDGSLGKLADSSKQGTSKTLADTYSDAGSDAGVAHSYRPTETLPLSAWLAHRAHQHALAVSGCSTMIQPWAADTGVDATFAQRQADLARIGNKSWNPKARAAALAKLFPR